MWQLPSQFSMYELAQSVEFATASSLCKAEKAILK